MTLCHGSSPKGHDIFIQIGIIVFSLKLLQLAIVYINAFVAHGGGHYSAGMLGLILTRWMVISGTIKSSKE